MDKPYTIYYLPMNVQEDHIKPVQFVQPDKNTWTFGNHIHVWKFPAVKSEFSFLTESERAFAKRFRSEEDSNRFSVGRQSLRFLLSKYLSVNPSEIMISTDAGRKPVMISPLSNFHFNISHSGDWVMLAFANDAIGIDIEKIDPDFKFDPLLKDHFSVPEHAFISGSPDPVSSFYYVWTRKEALTKGWGTGMQENLKSVEVLGKEFYSNHSADLWNLESFKISTLYPAALAFQGPTKNVKYFDGQLYIEWSDSY
jgi:4'-phosphopantetheinyl transferase